jgi:hypothetical protein
VATYILDGYEPVSRAKRVAFAIGLFVLGVLCGIGLWRTWRSRRAAKSAVR